MVVTNCFKRRVTNRPLTLKSIPCLLVVLLLFCTHISAFDWQRIMDIFHHYGFNGTVPGEGPSMTDMFGKVQGVLKEDPELWAWLRSKAQELKAKNQSPFDAGLDLFKEFQSFMKERNAKDAESTTSRMEAKQNQRDYYATRGPGPNIFYMYHNTMDGDKKYQYEHEVHGYHKDGETNFEETIKTNGDDNNKDQNQNQYYNPGPTQSYYNPNNNQPNVPPGGGYHQQGYRSERYDFTKDNGHPQAHGPNANTGGYGHPPNNGPYYDNSYNPNVNQYKGQDHNQGYKPNQNNYNSYNNEQNTQQPPQYHNQDYKPNQDNYNSYNNEQNTQQPPQYHNQGYKQYQNNYNSYNNEQNTQQPPQYHNQGYRPNQNNYYSYNNEQNTQHTTQDHNQNYRPNQNNHNNEQNTHTFHYEQPHQTGNNQHKYGNNNQYAGYGYEMTTNQPPPTPKPFMPRFWDFFKNLKK